MSLPPHTPSAEYDVIFAGGGTTACVTAGRLASAAPHLRILLLEAGPSTKDKPEHIQPAHTLRHLAPHSKTMQFYQSPPSEYLDGRPIIVPSGKCVGGGSSVNFSLYNRPAASDLDAWEEQFDNVGWGSNDLIPLFQKAETYEIDPSKPTHGNDGLLKVSFGGPDAVMDIGKQFREIGAKFEKERPLSDEGNAFDEASINVFYNMPKWISSTGYRSDVAHHYVYNEGLGNLTVLDGCIVKRVIIDKGRATGVEYLFDKGLYPSAPQDVRMVKAKKLIVVSAGAMGSPLILERSGIGSREVLEKADIAVVHESPGVGEEYQDHPFYVTPYFASQETDTYDPVYRSDPETWPGFVRRWEKDGGGRLSGNGADGAIKMRPLPEELEELGDELKEHFIKEYTNKPDKPFFALINVAGLPGDQSQLPHVNYTCSGIILGYPESRGSLHVTSHDPYAPPAFESGFLSKSVDVAMLRWGYKKSREILRRLPAHRGALVPAHPRFSSHSKAGLALMEDVGQVSLDAPRIVYDDEDDRVIDENIRKMVQTTWHSLGTCAMKSFKQGGVVDSRLNVYGIEGLKIADLSIAPSNVNSNTNSLAVAIGEKAAIIISEELGIKL